MSTGDRQGVSAPPILARGGRRRCYRHGRQVARRPLGARQRERPVQQGQQGGIQAQGCQGERG